MRDPVELEVFKNLYHSIAEEMGAALRRTSFSPNIKERRDYSCWSAPQDRSSPWAITCRVHLGSMPMSVAAAVAECTLEPGDVVMLNDPFRGGTHLPDITLVMPVYISCGDGLCPVPAGRSPATTHPLPTSTLLPALTMPMLAELTQAPWDPAAKFTRKAIWAPPPSGAPAAGLSP